MGKPFTDKLMNGEMTFDDYKEMFYTFAKPLKIHRPLIPMPYRTAEEVARSDEVAWEGAWLSFRQRVLGDYTSRQYLRDMISAWESDCISLGCTSRVTSSTASTLSSSIWRHQ